MSSCVITLIRITNIDGGDIAALRTSCERCFGRKAADIIQTLTPPACTIYLVKRGQFQIMEGGRRNDNPSRA